MDLVLFGPPGAGKGTQAKKMEITFSAKQISTGDMLRAAKASGTPLGDEAKGYMASGKLVPDDLVIRLIEARIQDEDCAGGFIMDGFPRTVTQAQAFDQMLTKAERNIAHVVCIEVEDGEIISRMGGRRMCKACGASFHVSFNPPKAEGVCDLCDGELYQRDDDQPETVQARLMTYHEQTAPVAAYYADQGLLRSVSGVGAIDQVFDSVVAAVKGA
jgi:adenylate kinase